MDEILERIARLTEDLRWLADQFDEMTKLDDVDLALMAIRHLQRQVGAG